MKQKNLLDDRGASLTDDCRSNSDKEDWETAFALLIGGICVATVGSFLFYVAYVFLRRRHQMALEAILEATITASLQSVNAMEHPVLLMSAKRFLETMLNDLHRLLNALNRLHATHRNMQHLIYLDSSEGIQGFKTLWKFIILFSYQWLSWIRLAQIPFSSMQ